MKILHLWDSYSPGLFDQHGRLRAKGTFDDLIPPSLTNSFAVHHGQPTQSNPAGGAEYAASLTDATLR